MFLNTELKDRLNNKIIFKIGDIKGLGLEGLSKFRNQSASLRKCLGVFEEEEGKGLGEQEGSYYSFALGN